MSKKVCVIGAGVAGLTVASILAHKGYQVKLYESSNDYGGKLGVLKVGSSSFDYGPSLCTEPEVIDEVYALCGEDPRMYWDYSRLSEGTRYFWDTKTFLAKNNTEELIQQISREFNEPPEAVNNYLERLSFLYHKIGPLFLDHNLDIRNIRDYIKPTLLARTVPWLWKDLNSYNNSNFNSKELVQLLNRFATYSGSDPYRAPAILAAAGAPEILGGSFYPKGGMRSIAEGLYQLGKNSGVEFIFGQRINEIIKSKNSQLVVSHKVGRELFDEVVYCGDSNKLPLLLGKETKTKVSKKSLSTSGVVFYWEVKTKQQTFGLHNIIFSKDYQKEFTEIAEIGIAHEPTIYINITSAVEPDQSKKGHQNWFIMINCRAGFEPNIKTLEAVVKKRIEAKLNQKITISAKEVLTPKKLESQTGSYLGAIYGLDSNNIQRTVLKNGLKARGYHNLYLAGGTVHPGGGVPLSVRSAKIVASML